MHEVNLIVIIPVYNSEDYLERAVGSVTSQDYGNWRLILVDDGSTDASAALCERLSQNSDRIFAIHQENMGQLSARVSGIRYARNHLNTDNTFFLFLDADDIFVPDAFSRITEMIVENSCDLLIFGIEKQNSSAGLTDRSMQGTFEGAAVSRAELYRVVLFDYQYNSLCRKAVSAALIPDRDYSELYHLRHGEDLLQSYDYYKNSKKAFFSKELLYVYYTNEESVTNKRSLDGFQYNSQVRAWIWDRVVNEKIWSQDDLKAFSQYNCRLLRNKIMSLCRIDAPAQEIIAILKRMKADPFYQRIVAENSGYDRIIRLFDREAFQKLIRFIRLRLRMIHLLPTAFVKH